QPGRHDLAVDGHLDLAGLRVIRDAAVLEVRYEQIADGVLVADGQAQRTCRTVIAGARGRAVRVAWDIPGLPDLAQGDIRGRAGLVVLGGDRAALELLEYHAALPFSRVAVTRQWLAESLLLIVACRRVLGRDRAGQSHLDVALSDELHLGGLRWGFRCGGGVYPDVRRCRRVDALAIAAARSDQRGSGQADDCRVAACGRCHGLPLASSR